MTERLPLPERRLHESLELLHWGREWRIGLGRSAPMARVTEVFLSSGRSGEQAEIIANDASIILSIALQYGVPIEAFSRSIMREPTGAALGPIGAIVDLIVKDEAER